MPHTLLRDNSAKIKWMGRLLRRVLSFFQSDGHLSRTLVAQRLKRPTRELGRAALKRSLFGLAPNEVYLADSIT